MDEAIHTDVEIRIPLRQYAHLTVKKTGTVSEILDVYDEFEREHERRVAANPAF